ncbi:MAG: SpoIID/LytB domain-containing protein [Myxococcales bacterium]|jgi:stage II sporulation protein D
MSAAALGIALLSCAAAMPAAPKSSEPPAQEARQPALEPPAAPPAASEASAPEGEDPSLDLPDPNDPLERLYGRKQLSFEGGVPYVTVRLMEGQPSVTFVPKGRMRLHARGGLNKVLEAPAGSAWTVRLKHFEPGVVVWSVQVAELRHDDKAGLAEAKALWTGRGFEVRTSVAGSRYGIAGKVLDNRRYLVFIGPKQTEEQAKATLKDLHQRFGFQGSLVPSLKRRPRGLLEVLDEHGIVMAIAENLVSVSSPDGGPFLVKSVEHGVGYSWHGRQDRTYRGDLELVVDRLGGISVVNALPLESYVRGIVPSEIYARAHPEALKAQSVTARGEVLAKIGTRHLTDPYLLCAEQHCQVYTGLSGEAATTDKAIADTAGEILFSPDGRLVDSVYSAVCGGHTEDNEVVWGGVPNPSLRGRPDFVEGGGAFDRIGDKNLSSFLRTPAKSYCAISSFSKASKYRWERRFSQAEVDEITRHLGVGHVRVLALSARGSSGRASVLSISGDDGATQVRGELNIRRLFKNLNSSMFEIEPPSKTQPDWIFRGGGWGHGVGMCQTGAIGRAERGQSYRDILRHYFNGAEPAKVY